MSCDVAELERHVDAGRVEWRLVAVADAVAMLPGFAFKSENFATDTDAGLPLVRIRDLGQTSTTTRYVGDYDEAFAVQDGDILVGMDGDFSAVRWWGGKALLNQRVLKLSAARLDAMDEGYLFYRVQPALAELEQTISGTTVKHLSTKDLKRLTWQIPPLDEQRRIAEVLRSVDEAIASESEYEQQAKVVRRAFLHEHFHMGDWADGSPLPDGWQLLLLDQVAVRGSGHTPNKKIPEYWNGGIKWVSLQDTKRLDNVYISETAQQISTDGISNSSAVLHPAGVVVISRDATVGRSAITAEAMAVSQHFIAYRCGSDLDNHYLYYWLQRMKPVFERVGAGSTIKTIGLPFFKGLRIALPPLGLQTEIASALLDMDQSIMACQRTLTSLVKMKAALMSDLLSGRVRVPA